MTKSKRLKSITAAIVGVLLTVSLAFGGISVLPASAATSITVDLSKQYQEFDGWGLSLSWWATEMGDWTRIGSSGKSKREEIMEALYGESGLDLNIARYNVGGGDDPSLTHRHMSDDRNTPGWRGATLVKEGDEEYYVPDERYVFEDENGGIIPWDQTPDRNQLWVLDWIQKNRDDVITEYYSNSPPYWMTKSGCSSGAVKGENDPKENLDDHYAKNWNLEDDDAHNEAFVRYLLDVYEYLTAQGFELGNIQPFNESGPNYWYWAKNGDQEGCHFSAEQQMEILNALDSELKARGLDVGYNYGDETNPGRAVNTYNLAKKYTTRDGTPGADIISGAKRLTYHIYSRGEGNERQMYINAKNNGQEIYMSEVSYEGASEYNPENMQGGFSYTDGIIGMLRDSKVDAYVFWQGMEDMVGQIKGDTNWGLIQGVYYTQDEALSQGYDLAANGFAYQDYVLSKSYYMSGQFTKYIRPGYTIVDTSDSKTVAALSPDGKTLVIVKQNNSGDKQNISFNLNGFRPYAAEKIVTDATHNWAQSSLKLSGGAFTDEISESSITTYVLHSHYAAATRHFIDDSSMQPLDSLAAIQKAFDANGDCEQIYGTFPQNGGSNATYFDTSYTRKSGDWLAFRFYGEGFDLIGSKKDDSGNISVWIDKDPTSESDKHGSKDLYSASSVKGDKFYSVSGLSKGWHTVYVKADDTGTSGKQYVNYDAVFILQDAGDASDAEVDYLEITAAYGAGNTVALNYDIGGLDGCELYGEYLSGDSWVRSNEAFADGVGKISVTNGLTSVRARISAVKDGETVCTSEETLVDLNARKEGVLYFADCGSTGGLLRTGAVLGECQGVADKAFGKDPVTGLNWGYDTVFSNAGDVGYFATYEAMTSVMSTQKTSGDSLSYKFTIPVPGTYKVAVGFYGGSSGWGSRRETLTVSGNAPRTVNVNERSYSAEFLTVTTHANNEVITVQVDKPTGETQDALLSLIVITEQNAKLPLYTDKASTYNTGNLHYETIDALQNAMDAVMDESVTVRFTDGSSEVIAADGAGVESELKTQSFMGRMRATLHISAYTGMDAYLDYMWQTDDAPTLYYNIDCGFVDVSTVPPYDEIGMIGAKQSTTLDRAYTADAGTDWGYETANSGGTFWANDADPDSSMREGGEGDGIRLTYSMNGFEPNELLFAEVTGNIHDWGSRSFTVYCNGTKAGDIRLTGSKQTDTAVYSCTATDKGELKVQFSSKAVVASVRVWSRTSGQTELSYTRAAAVTADKEAASRSETIVLGAFETDARVYVTDDSNRLLGTFAADGDSKTINVADYLKTDSYALQFVQVCSGKLASEPLVIEFPGTVCEVEGGYKRDGEYAVIRFTPKGVTQGITALTLLTPDGVTVDLTEGYFFRTRQNGVYTVSLTSGNMTFVQTVTVDCIDSVDFRETFSTAAWTTGSVTLTLAPVSVSGDIAAMYVNGEPVTLSDGKYTAVATQNTEYAVRVITRAGNVYERTFAVTNIDSAAPVLSLDADFTGAGVTLRYDAQTASGGTLGVRFNDEAVRAVTDGSEVDMTRAGKYTFTFTNAAGVSTEPKVYYVSYGAGEKQFANVSVDASGNVTVSGADSSKLYRAGESSALASLKADKAGKYYLHAEKDGETEIVVLQVASSASGKIVNGNAGESGSVAGMVAGIVIGAAAIAAAAGLCVWMLLRRRKA